MRTPIFIGSEIYRGSTFGPKHPLAIPRVSTVMDLCRAMTWLPETQYRTSPRAKPAALTRFHTPDYISALQKAEQDQAVSDAVRERHGLGTMSNPIYAEMYRRPATSAGGSLLGAELIANGGIVYSPGGGTHHGMADRAAGFCFLNDPVLAILALREMGLRRIAYVDIDAHHCDGVEAALAGLSEVRMISVHEARRWPFTGALKDDAGGNAFNLPVPRGLNDSEFRMILNDMILPLVDDHRPDALILQCGADAVDEDPLSRLSLSNNAHWSAVAALKTMCPKLLVLGGGGYNPWTVARLWTGVWATLNAIDIPDHLSPAAQSVLQHLVWHRQRNTPVPRNLTTTLRDAPREGDIRPEIPTGINHLTQRILTLSLGA